ncbi:hypothetical protein QZH41_015463, partial [Actinostola sp. cb2023]
MKATIETLQSTVAADGVTRALNTVRQLEDRPARLMDPMALLAALELLADAAPRGYDHIALSPQSRTYFGIEWQGWYFVYHTIPFGWKASAYVYHTIGMAATSHIRSMGIPCSQYIDDRHFGQLTPPHELAPTTQAWSDLELAEAAIFTAASVLTSLGYFVGLAKSSLVPSRIVRFLGFMVDSDRQAFILPKEKKEKFARQGEAILASRSTSIKTLQRLAGKIKTLLPSQRLARNWG